MHSYILYNSYWHGCTSIQKYITTLRPRQNGRHFQTTFWNRLSWVKIYEFRSKIRWSLFLGAVNTIPTTQQAIIWKCWFAFWRVYASLNELTPISLSSCHMLWCPFQYEDRLFRYRDSHYKENANGIKKYPDWLYIDFYFHTSVSVWGCNRQ